MKPLRQFNSFTLVTLVDYALLSHISIIFIRFVEMSACFYLANETFLLAFRQWDVIYTSLSPYKNNTPLIRIYLRVS